MSVVEGWKTGELGELCSIEIGGTPSRSNPNFWDTSKETSNRWVSIRDLNRTVIVDTAEHISDSGVKHSNVKLQHPGTVLLSFKLSIGRVAFAGVPLYTNEAIAGLNSKKIDPIYLFHGLHQWDLLQGVDQAIKGATLNKAKLKKINFQYPTALSEQTKIAEILSMVDRAIEQTEALIAKQQRIKTGLMQDLFTRGIDEHGNLRTEQTHKFKDSTLGRIPVEWEVVKLSHYVTFIRSGLSRRLLENDVGIPVITSTNIQQSLLDTKNLSYWYLKDPQGAKTATYFLDDGDILLNFINSIDQIGKVCIFEDIGRPTIYTTNLFRIKASKVSSQAFLFHLLDSHIVQNEIKFITKPAVNQASFTTGDFLGIAVPLVPYDEQLLIVEFLSALNNNQNRVVLSLAKINHEKTGLMQDLLTGKKRVTDLLNDTEISDS
jgi:type I restriction enzyme S subunit